MNAKILSRDQFVNSCLKRDNHCCVICESTKNIVVHHILERRLWTDGSSGYYENNGASLCEEHHLDAEMTILSVEKIREACGISESNKIIPEMLYDDQQYTKWGDPILPNGSRMRGELFDDPGVQKILDRGKVLHLYTKYVKYPRSPHLSWSPGATKDDRIIKSTDHFKGKEVVVTIKMDGENCLDGDTLITTKNGQVPIKELCNRDEAFEVLSFNHETGQQEWKNVEAKRILPPSEDWYEIELENGQSIRLTGEHRVWCENLNCYRMVKDLDGSEELQVIGKS